MSEFIATCAKGLEYVLVDELKAIGAENVKEGLSQATFEADWKTAYKALMWSRIASRILYPLATFEAFDDEMLYQQVSIIDWSQHVKPGASLLVNSQSYRSKLSHTQFISQRVKDGVVDYFREQEETLPFVEYEEPDVAIHCRIRRNKVTLCIDLAGAGLHRRNYRLQGGGAPIKENLAAALLTRAGWPDKFDSLVDPMCGSGTFLIEGAMMALEIAPGLFRDYLGLFGWAQFNSSLWEEVKSEAENQRKLASNGKNIKLWGSDINPRAIQNAQSNIAIAGLDKVIKLNIAGLDQLEQFNFGETGLVIINPPYSERLGEREDVKKLYFQLGQWFKSQMKGWHASVLSPDKEFGHAISIRAKKIYKFNNGSIPCELLNLVLSEENFIDRVPDDVIEVDFKSKLSDNAVQFCNRLEKNLSKLKKWLKKENISCFRAYDADLPEFNAAIDVYDDQVHIQEYKAPKSVDSKQASRRLSEIKRVTAGVFEIPRSRVHVKQRQQQKGNWQYQKSEETQINNNFFRVSENGHQFWVNLVDYLDTGLFLDHRKTREFVASKAAGKRFLNLFCYTASVSVYAAKHGAKESISVDMSKTYLSWAKRNFTTNNISLEKHQLEREDCLKWLEMAKDDQQKFDLIFLDPPTFSNSKKMEEHFDVQSAHPEIIQQCLDILAPNGELIFSNNFKKFEMLFKTNEHCSVEEITRKTVSPDFERNNLHRAWVIKNKG